MDRSTTYTRALLMLRQYMVKHPRMRSSLEREHVLQIVCRFDRAFTIGDVMAAVEQGEVRISKASLYNHMLLFTEINVIHRLDRQFGQDKTLYVLTLGRPESMQIICQRCGRVASFRDVAIHRILRERRYTNFVPETYSLYVFGLCKICRSIEIKTGKGRNYPKLPAQ